MFQANTNFMRLWVCGKVVHNKCQPIKNGLRMCLNGFHATLELAKPVFRQNPCLGLVKVVKVKYFGFGTFWALFTFFFCQIWSSYFNAINESWRKNLWIIYIYSHLKLWIRFASHLNWFRQYNLKRFKKSTQIFSTQSTL